MQNIADIQTAWLKADENDKALLALSLFCGAEGIDKLETASTYRALGFGQDYGVYMAEDRLGGLLARAVVVVNESGRGNRSELVPEIAQEPDYDAAISVL